MRDHVYPIRHADTPGERVVTIWGLDGVLETSPPLEWSEASAWVWSQGKRWRARAAELGGHSIRSTTAEGEACFRVWGCEPERPGLVPPRSVVYANR